MSCPENLAHSAVSKAIREGVLAGEPACCTVCGKAGSRREKTPDMLGTPSWNVVYHHHSYDPAFWLDVVAVCRSCHNRIHLGQIPEPITGELRTGARVKRSKRRKSPDVLIAYARARGAA